MPSRSSSRRASLDVASDILHAALEGERKTRIMYRANLDTRAMRRYFALLIDRGLLQMVDDGDAMVYRTTGKGRMFIDDYQRFRDLFLETNRVSVPP